MVFVAKRRKNLFDLAALNTLKRIFIEVCQDFEAELKSFNGEEDQVHLLVNDPPKVAISKLVNSLKGLSSQLLRKERLDLAEVYFKNVLWSPSYFASSCGGAPLTVIQQYIDQQNAPD